MASYWIAQGQWPGASTTSATTTPNWLLGTLAVDERIVVPSIWSIEIANVLAVGERRKRLERNESTQPLDRLDRLAIGIVSRPPYATMRDVLAVAREYDLSTYDASYMELEMRVRVPLATLDAGLALMDTSHKLFKMNPSLKSGVLTNLYKLFDRQGENGR